MKSTGVVRDRRAWSVLAISLLILALAPGHSFSQATPKLASAPAGSPKSEPNFVSVIPFEGRLAELTNLFDLQGKTLRLTPQSEGAYKVETLPTSAVVACDTELEDQGAQGPYFSRSWAVPLSFQFPFAGKQWERIYVNRNGNISFQNPESEYWSARDPWADGGMCSVAAAIDSRAAAGLEQMIAVLWAHVDPDPRLTEIRITQGKDSLAVTWKVIHVAWGQVVAGSNTFQARLHSSGVIEMVYSQVLDRDGIVGVFTGQAVRGARLHHWEFKGQAPDPSVAIVSADIYDAGSVLRFVIEMKEDVITRVDGGASLDYRCLLGLGGRREQISVTVTDAPRSSCWLGASPRTCGFRIHRKIVEMYVSKVLLRNVRQISPTWNVIWWGIAGRDVSSGDTLPAVDLSHAARAEIDWSAAAGTHSGNIFEVFHYAAVTKMSENILKSIYEHVPAEDDIALVFTDFRIDDLYAQGGGAIAANFPIKGIGPGQEQPRSTMAIGSKKLQMSMATVWIGAPLFAETGPDGDPPWHNYAHAVKWIVHESTHRWGMGLSFRNPGTGNVERLADGVGHWVEGLDTTSMHPMGARYLDAPSAGYSVMGGAAWRKNADATFSKSDLPDGVPGGYSPLDLYVMGLLSPEKVPTTFVLENVKDLGQNKFSGTNVPVRIEDIVSAMGPRVPASADAQKAFKMTLYLLHERGREVDPEMLTRAKRLSVAVADFFMAASGGAMKVVATQ